MTKNSSIILVFILVLISCNRNENQQVSNEIKNGNSLKYDKIENADYKNDAKKIAAEDEETLDEYYNYKNVSLKKDYKDSISMCFSDADNKDLFTFYVPKGNISNTYSILTIRNNQKKIIFELKFNTYELINGYATLVIKNDNQMIKYLLAQAQNVLNPDSFLNFNKLDKESYFNDLQKDEYYDYNTLEEVKRDNRLIFILSREEENTIYYGFSKEKKKVIEIYGCC